MNRQFGLTAPHMESESIREGGLSTSEIQSGQRDATLPNRPNTQNTNPLEQTSPAPFRRVSGLMEPTEAIKHGYSPHPAGNPHENGAPNMPVDETIVNRKTQPIFQDADKARRLLDQDRTIIQNQYGYPYQLSPGNLSTMEVARYDYRTLIGSPRYGATVNLEDKMMEMRASLGLPIHGNTDTAKAMRYFMYNRWKTPDINLAHNKGFTYVFFTRPDLNILLPQASGGGIHPQCANHTESAMTWMRNPELFKLLVDSGRIGDDNNFNMLLSNAVQSFPVQDEQLNTVESGKSWNDYVAQYAESYTGRSAGEFDVTFGEDRLYSVITLIKLWITYMDNVARGAWLPSYNLTGQAGTRGTPELHDSHVYTKTLDYACSAYVIRVGEDGSDILYWTKYFGVYPTNTGSSILSWNIGDPPGNRPSPNIRFKYYFKRDLSPISLLEFNHNARLREGEDTVMFESQWNDQIGHASRPYVGTPFIQMYMPDPVGISLRGNGVGGGPRAKLRLQFRPTMAAGLTDRLVYRNTLSPTPTNILPVNS